MLPFEMNRFWPFSTHSFPSSRAVVARFPASLPLGEGHEPGLLLRLRAEPHEGGLAQRRLDRDRRAHGRRAAADLLDEQHERDIVHPGAAVLLGHGSAQET